jgi:uncharacterized protein YukE
MASLQSAFSREQVNVQSLISAINGSLDSTWWVGPQAERFRGEWQGSFLPNLNNLAAALGECATNVQQHAQGFVQVGG